MAPLRRVPWYSSLEWMDVYNGVFSSDSSKRDAAIARISLWEMKSNRVPVAVNLTRLILKALKADQDGTRSTTELRMLYGAAIVRFVNTHVDLQQNRVYAQSIATIALDLGIPSEVVDCRHRITHQDMPTLHLLRHTAGICFDFIRAKYWEPQAELVRSRLASMSQSKYLASGLVALLHDLENFAPPDDLEASLQRLVDEVSPRRGVSMRTLLFAAADVAGLKQKDAMRILRRMGMPEYFSQPAFVAASTWCQQVRKTLPKCMEFLETILHQCPHENVTLSFLKDLVLIAYDSDINPAAVLAVLWILGRASPNLAYRLISRVVNSLISKPSSSDDNNNNSLPMASSTGCSDFKYFSSTEDNFGDDGVGNFCYDTESFSLWLRAMDVPPEEEEQLSADLCNFGYQDRLVSWLRTLLLLPSDRNDTNSESPQLPFCLELLLHLFCDLPSPTSFPAPSPKLANLTPSNQSSGLAGLASTTRDMFCQRLLQCVNTAHSRVLAACRANIDTVARTAFRVLFVDPSVSQHLMTSEQQPSDTQRGLKSLLHLFEEADVRVPNGAASRLVEWVSARMLRRMDGVEESICRPQRQALQRLLLPIHRDSLERDNPNHHPFLTDQFKAVLANLLQLNSPEGSAASSSPGCQMETSGNLELFPPSQAALVQSGLAAIRSSAIAATESATVQELSTLEIPWTHPGTFPVQIGGNRTESKPIIELLPLSGNHITAPVTEILRSFSNQPEQYRRGVKRTACSDAENGEIFEGGDVENLPRHPAKRSRPCNPSTATERFIFDHNGCSTRDDFISRAVKFTPTAIQQLETEIIRAQQQQHRQDGSEPFQCDGDRLMQDWCSLQEILQGPKSS